MLGNQSLLLSRHKDLSGVTSIVKTTEALTYRPPLFFHYFLLRSCEKPFHKPLRVCTFSILILAGFSQPSQLASTLLRYRDGGPYLLIGITGKFRESAH